MILRFNFEKSLQAAALLLHLDGKRMERIRLLKLLYIADREMLGTFGQSITGDTGYAMNHGPVLTRVYNCIKGSDVKAPEWSKFIQSDGHAVTLVGEPMRGALSRAEIDKLTEVTDRFRNQSEWELSELTHEFPEWKNHFVLDTAVRIPWEEVLQAQGKEAMIEVVKEDQAIHDAFDDLFGD